MFKKVTIITSFFNADVYIDHYLNNVKNIIGYEKIVEHHAYNIIGSHKNNEYVNNKLKTFSNNHPNFKLIKIEKDPGLYSLWNRSCKEATTPYMMTLNIDDMCEPNFIVKALMKLEKEDADLVSCPVKVTKKINASFNDYYTIWYSKKKIYYDNRFDKMKQLRIANVIKKKDGSFHEIISNRLYKNLSKKIDPKYKRSVMVDYKYYSVEDMFIDWNNDNIFKSYNMPHCCPIWKRKIHKKYGYFNEEKYGVFADFEFWLRLLKNGRRFIQMSKPMVLYLEDENSHNRRDSKRREFMDRIKRDYL